MGGKDYQFIRSIYRHIFIPPPFWRDRGVNLRWTPTPEKKKHGSAHALYISINLTIRLFLKRRTYNNSKGFLGYLI